MKSEGKGLLGDETPFGVVYLYLFIPLKTTTLYIKHTILFYLIPTVASLDPMRYFFRDSSRTKQVPQWISSNDVVDVVESREEAP
ncbi:hypothetical protein BO99DRAFT_238448 [Aspergillus violaceofuscus CBS 115571]|uniref:Uncharacterized protein n=1 Tax=Aspergillus violaceofuscus (strain CBS 115571) TaxID=1450538 RepID=A0A2V5H1Z4_ASPV1|nr:hypothetical protein BO99DRAFT_238448 [Aspergillus violaceofuscus CBS 115571]